MRYLAPLLLFFFLVFCGLFARSLFRIKKIDCLQQGEVCDANHISFFTPYIGESSFSPIYFDIPNVRGSVQVSYPSTLTVRIDSPKIFAKLQDAADQDWYIFSDGSLQKNTNTLLTLDQQVQILDMTVLEGQTRYPENLFSLLKLVVAQKDLYIQKVTIKRPEEVVLSIEMTYDVQISADDAEKQLHSLQLILSSPTIEKKRARIDMRFDRPVLQYL